MTQWPDVRLDHVDRLRIIARTLPHVALVEREIPAPFDSVWSIVGDLEGGPPRYETFVRSAQILERDGDRHRLVARGLFGAVPFDVLLQPGFCVMHGGRVDVGMAARPTSPNTTLFSHFEGRRGAGRLLRPCFDVRSDVKSTGSPGSWCRAVHSRGTFLRLRVSLLVAQEDTAPAHTAGWGHQERMQIVTGAAGGVGRDDEVGAC